MKQKIRLNEQVGTSLKAVWDCVILSQASRGISDATIRNYRKLSARQSAAVSELVLKKQEEVFGICEKGSRLL